MQNVIENIECFMVFPGSPNTGLNNVSSTIRMDVTFLSQWKELSQVG